jgi:hypothetical protein
MPLYLGVLIVISSRLRASYRTCRHTRLFRVILEDLLIMKSLRYTKKVEVNLSSHYYISGFFLRPSFLDRNIPLQFFFEHLKGLTARCLEQDIGKFVRGFNKT